MTAITQTKVNSCFVNFFSNLFQSQRDTPQEMGIHELHDINSSTLSSESRDLLVAPINDSKVKEVVFAMEHTKAAGPDSLHSCGYI